MSNIFPAPVIVPPGSTSFDFPDFQPFSARAGIGYQDLLENIRYYLERKLGPYVRDLPGQLQFQIDTALKSITEDVAAITDGLTTTATLLTAAGVDLTGATDSTAALNAYIAALPDGAELHLPSSGVITLSDSIECPKRIHLSGGIELRWVSGIDSKPLIHVHADGSSFTGLYITNPNHLRSLANARTRGIYIEANNITVAFCRIVGQQQAIFVEAGGEWYNHIIFHNFVLDVPGDGLEDRGDGIYTMGATAIITGNRVELLDNSDGRIGIGLEGLANFEQVTYKHSDSLCVVTNNIVTGKFRRGITSESVNYVTLANNVISDSTWWALSNINANGCSITDNVINWTRTATDLQGADYTPTRCVVMLYGSGQNNVVRGNTVVASTTGIADTGIAMQTANTGSQVDPIVEGNDLANFPCYSSIGFNGGAGEILRPNVKNNKCRGFTHFGVYLYNCGDAIVNGNDITGTASTKSGDGIHHESSLSNASYDFNRIQNVDTAIRAYNLHDMVTANGNVIDGANTGIDMFGTAGATASINRIKATTPFANMPTGAVMVGNA